MTQDTATEVARLGVQAKEDLIRQAITRKIGNEWTLDDLKGRLRSTRYFHSEAETITLDGEPILTVLPPSLTQRHEGDQTILRVTIPHGFH